MELYQETRRYNSTSSWSPSCNRRVARARTRRERERKKKREKTRERERDHCSVTVHPTYFVVVVVPFVPRGFLFYPAAAALSSRFLCTILTCQILLSFFREHLSISRNAPKEITIYHAYFLNLKDSRGRFGVRRRREGVHAGHGRVVWR